MACSNLLYLIIGQNYWSLKISDSRKDEDIFSIKGPSTLATLFCHRWPRFCGGDIKFYSRRKPLYSSFGEHTAVCGSSVRQAVTRPRHRQSVFVAAIGKSAEYGHNLG